MCGGGVFLREGGREESIQTTLSQTRPGITPLKGIDLKRIHYGVMKRQEVKKKRRRGAIEETKEEEQ